MTKRGNRTGTHGQSGKPIPADYNVGFLVGVAGAEVPDKGTLRLGGDGRAAAVQAVEVRPVELDYQTIVATRRCRLVLTSPGIFASPCPAGDGVRAGWLPTGMSQAKDGTIRFDLHGVRGKLVCAAVPRADMVSGWDLAKWQPKAAQRAAPVGSVYWLEDLDTTADALRKLAESGLWPDVAENTSRRAEGFNRVAVAAWRSA